MLTRREMLRSLGMIGVGAAAAPLVAGCGGAPGPGPRPGPGPGLKNAGYTTSAVPRVAGSKADGAIAAGAVGRFTTDLYTRLASRSGNLVCSPYSVAVALALTRNGARGRTATEMDAVLHVGELDAYNQGMNWLDHQLESRAGKKKRADDTLATVGLATANSLWGQRGTRWEKPFLDELARDYGAGMRLVDYVKHTEQARTAINAWTSERTHDKISEIIPSGVLDAMTRLVLVNAIWFKAPWEEPFEKSSTKSASFTRDDGSSVSTKLMSAELEGASYAEGPGWVAAQLPYAGHELAMAIVVPTGSTGLRQIEGNLAGGGLERLLSGFTTSPGLKVEMPRWKFRTAASLSDALTALGMPTAFSVHADFGAMTTDGPLSIGAVLHQAFVAVDEEGTEAAAATAAVVRALSAQRPAEPRVVHADRAFLFVLHDVATGTPLFIGRVDDPTKS